MGVSVGRVPAHKLRTPTSLEQLEALERQIKAKLESDEHIDTDYWEQLLKSLLVFKAKAKLNKFCDAIKEKDPKFEAEDGEEQEMEGQALDYCLFFGKRKD